MRVACNGSMVAELRGPMSTRQEGETGPGGRPKRGASSEAENHGVVGESRFGWQ